MEFDLSYKKGRTDNTNFLYRHPSLQRKSIAHAGQEMRRVE